MPRSPDGRWSGAPGPPPAKSHPWTETATFVSPSPGPRPASPRMITTDREPMCECAYSGSCEPDGEVAATGGGRYLSVATPGQSAKRSPVMRSYAVT